MTVQNKVALITGGAMGLGQALCLRFAKAGAKIGFCDLSESLLEETTQKVREAGGECLAMICDVTDENQVDRWISASAEHFGRIDILINNAGILHKPEEKRPVHEYSISAFDRVMAVNVRGVFLCLRRVVPELVKAGGGCIINIGSVDGLRPLRDGVAYSVSKAACHFLTLSAAQDLARMNIRVNAIAPSLFDSAMVRGRRPVLFEEIAKVIPIPRLTTTEDVAAAAIFLAGDGASFITAHILVVDGGYISLGTRQAGIT